MMDLATASARVLLKSTATMILWRCIVASIILLVPIPAFVDSAVTMPLMVHATRDVYRRVVLPGTRFDLASRSSRAPLDRVDPWNELSILMRFSSIESLRVQ